MTATRCCGPFSVILLLGVIYYGLIQSTKPFTPVVPPDEAGPVA